MRYRKLFSEFQQQLRLYIRALNQLNRADLGTYYDRLVDFWQIEVGMKLAALLDMGIKVR